MTEIINTYTIHEEAEAIVDEGIEHHAKYSPNEDIEDFMDTWIHETVDSHRWVIYYHNAHKVAYDAKYGEDWVEDLGITPKSYDDYATHIAFGELYTAANNYWFEIKDQMENEIAEAS